MRESHRSDMGMDNVGYVEFDGTLEREGRDVEEHVSVYVSLGLKELMGFLGIHAEGREIATS